MSIEQSVDALGLRENVWTLFAITRLKDYTIEQFLFVTILANVDVFAVG